MVARSLQVRADLLLSAREMPEAVRDLLDAEEKFRVRGFECAAATC